MKKNQCLINDNNINDILDKIFNLNFNNNYDHGWIQYIYKNQNISDYNYCHIYFKNCYIKTILESSLYNEKTLNELIIEIIEKIKINNIKLEIYYLPDILNLNSNYELLYKIQSYDNELNTFATNEVHIKYISKKLLLIDFHIENDKIIFCIKHSKFFECNIDDINLYLKNNEIINKYRELENIKIKILMKSQFILYYDDDFVEYMFQKGYWIDYVDSFNKFVDLKLQTYYLDYCYYDIIIYDATTIRYLHNFIKNMTFEKNYYILNMLQNKMFIVLNNQLFTDIGIKSSINLDPKSNKFIYHSFSKMFELENLLKLTEIERNPKFTGATTKIEKINRRLDYIYEISNKCKLDLIKSSFNNFTILSKEDFFRNYNLDINKKLVVIYLGHPKNNNYKINDNDYYTKESNFRRRFEFELLEDKKFLINLCDSFKENNCNIIIKAHPREEVTYIPYNKIDIDSSIEECEITKNHIKSTINFLKDLNKKLLFIDHSYTGEIEKYSDYCVLLNATTCGWHNYLCDTPALSISTKKHFNWFLIHNFMINYYYGDCVYYEDIIDDINGAVYKFLNTNHKNNYKYFENHPLYGNAYNSNYKKLGNQIIDLINSNKNLKNTFNDIKLLINYDYITIYDNKNISLSLVNDEIIICINNNPSNSYGISIPVFKNKNLSNLKLIFDCKLDKEEDNINLKIYTGNKWIQLEKLSTLYKNFNICEEFNFNSKSKWRISSTSKLIGQKIYIKNIKFIDI